MKAADTPELVASAVVKASTAATPHRRYTAGRMARQISLLRRFVPRRRSTRACGNRCGCRRSRAIDRGAQRVEFTNALEEATNVHQNPESYVCSAEPGIVSIAHSLHGQSVTAGRYGKSGYKIELSYHVNAIQRDSPGQYTMSGTVNGERRGKATLVFGFDKRPSGEAGKILVHSSWIVTAVPAFENRSEHN